MRLWHKDLIPVLPRQQLLGQWRECCAIMANIAKNGTPNHVLVNKIMEYPPEHFYAYAKRVHIEMTVRGYNADVNKLNDGFKNAFGLSSVRFVDDDELYSSWHDDRYLTQCFYNLQEKYDCGAITDEEWDRIDYRYRVLTSEHICDWCGKPFDPEYGLFFDDVDDSSTWDTSDMKGKKLCGSCAASYCGNFC